MSPQGRKKEEDAEWHAYVFSDEEVDDPATNRKAKDRMRKSAAAVARKKATGMQYPT